MQAIRELLLLIRIAQCHMSAAYYRRDIERSRQGLVKALSAMDAANATLRIHTHSPVAEIPMYLLK